MSGAANGSDPQSEVPVLIVGAGPAGLAAAVMLARYGIEFLLVERRRELSRLPRSTGISTRTMELLRSWGLEEKVREGGVVTEWVHWICQSLVRAPSGHGYPTGYPTTEQAAVISPTTPACVPQDHLEPVLLNYLESLDTGRVEFGSEVASIENRADRVRVELRDGEDGTSRVVDARYLIGADGAHSTVRRVAGIEMRGSNALIEAVTTLFRAPLWELVPEHRFGIYMITHPEAEGALRPTGHGDRWDYVIMYESGKRAVELAEEDMARQHLYRRAWFGGLRVADLTEEGLAQRIRLAVGAPTLEPRIERIAGFSFAAQVAESFRVGNVFLVGDAAHRATPRGGTGMNTAVQDSYDLGWKLAWVLRGWADPELLDSYEVERRPVVEHNVALSADSRRLFREPGQELPADLGGRIRHVWTTGMPGASDRVSTLDLLGPGLTLFTGPERTPWEAEAAVGAARLPVEVRSLDVINARAIGIPAGGALMARPDGVPAASFAPGMDTVDALRAAVADPIPTASPQAA